MRTLILLDWDDTIFPTTHHLKTYDTNYKHLDTVNIKLLETLHELGTIVILTNATYKWIDESSRYIPKTRQYIHDMKIKTYSAQDYCGNITTDWMKWKKYMLDEIMRRHYSKYNQLVSIGDSDAEKNAVIDYANEYPRIKIKTIKMIESPSESEIIQQFQYIESIIGKFIYAEPELIHIILNR